MDFVPSLVFEQSGGETLFSITDRGRELERTRRKGIINQLKKLKSVRIKLNFFISYHGSCYCTYLPSFIEWRKKGCLLVFTFQTPLHLSRSFSCLLGEFGTVIDCNFLSSKRDLILNSSSFYSLLCYLCFLFSFQLQKNLSFFSPSVLQNVKVTF